MLKIGKSQPSVNNPFNELVTQKILPSPTLQSGGVKGLEKAIFATIAYYDHFNYPLTAAEIYYNLTNCEQENQSEKLELSEILRILDDSGNIRKKIDCYNGFYFLTGREEVIAARIQKKKLTDEKLKKTRWLLRFISKLPFVRFVAISGSMGIGNPDKKSDIDLLVIAKHGRIWTARAFLTFFALILGAYRHSDKTANRLCLNHYITDRSLAIDFGNLYKAEEYLNIFPVAGDLNLYKKFLDSNAVWLKRYVHANFNEGMNKNLFFINSGSFAANVKRAAEYLLLGVVGSWLERKFRKIQIYYIKKNPLTNHPHSRIRYTDDNLVFHPILVEPKIIAEHEEKMRQFDTVIT